MEYRIHRLRSDFIRNVALLTGGSAGAQFITVLLAPVVTRLYAPEAIGHLGTFVSIVTVISAVAAMGYPVAVILPKSDREAVTLACIALVSASIFSLGVFIVILGGIYWGNSPSNIPLVATILVPVAVFLTVSVDTVGRLLARVGAFAATARNAFGVSVGLNLAKVGAGTVLPFSATLIALQVTASAAHLTLLSRVVLRHFNRHISFHNRPRLSDIIETAKRYYDYPLYRAPQNFLNTVSNNFPLLLLMVFFGPAAAGFYALARTVLSVPARLVARSVYTVFYTRISHPEENDRPLTGQIVITTIGLTLIGIVPFSVVFVYGNSLFSLIFGAGWSEAGIYASWLSVMLFMHFVNRPAVAAVSVLGIERGLLGYEIISTSAKVSAIVCGAVVWGESEMAIMLFSWAGAGSYVGLIAWVIVKSRRDGVRRER